MSLSRVVIIGSYFGLAITLFSNLDDFVRFSKIVKAVTEAFGEYLATIFNWALGWLGFQIDPTLAILLTSVLCLLSLVATTWYYSDLKDYSATLRVKATNKGLANPAKRKWQIFMGPFVICLFVYGFYFFVADGVDEMTLQRWLSVAFFAVIVTGLWANNIFKTRYVTQISFQPKFIHVFRSTCIMAIIAGLMCLPIVVTDGFIDRGGAAPSVVDYAISAGLLGLLVLALPYYLLSLLKHRVSRPLLNARLEATLIVFVFICSFNLIALALEDWPWS